MSMLVLVACRLGGLWDGGLEAVVTWPEVAKDWESCSCCSPGARAEVESRSVCVGDLLSCLPALMAVLAVSTGLHK